MTNEKNHFMAAIPTTDKKYHQLLNKAREAYDTKFPEVRRLVFDASSKETEVLSVLNVPALGDCLFHALWLLLFSYNHPTLATKTKAFTLFDRKPHYFPQECEQMWKKQKKETAMINDSSVGHPSHQLELLRNSQIVIIIQPHHTMLENVFGTTNTSTVWRILIQIHDLVGLHRLSNLCLSI